MNKNHSRMRTTLLFLLILLLFSAFYFKAPVDFAAPVAGPLRLSGTFGELRPNHFHAGIDIKGSIGEALYAVADGYVSRIKVEGGGYGNALYIDHPNGYTSVYAHLDRFTPEVAAYVKSVQYEKESFAIDVQPEPGRFPFSKGQEIGRMGITGSSFGPHLHFEIRDTESEMPVNPLALGLEVADRRPPRMHQLRIYSLDEERRTLDQKTYNLIGSGGDYGVSGDTIRLAAEEVGLALKVYDHMDGVSNWNGIYAMSLYVDDSLAYAFSMDRFSFAETRYINAHMDFAARITSRSYFNRMYRLPGNALSTIYSDAINDGVIALSERRATKVTLIARDLAGNARRFECWLRRDGNPPEADHGVYNYFLPYDEENLIDQPGIELFFSEGTFYQDLYLFLEVADDQSADIYSAVYHLGDPTTPVHHSFEMAIRPRPIPDELRARAFIALCEPNNRVTNYGGRWGKGRLKTKVRTLGDYCVMIDTIKPRISAVDFNTNMSGWRTMAFVISDNLPTTGPGPELAYRATIDGQWILMEYDAKKDRITHYFDGTFPAGKHQFRLEVTDRQGNMRVLEREILL